MLIMPAVKNICSKCFNNIQKKCEIICEICQCKFHKICAKIENENAFNSLLDYENIVFNCDNCLHSSRDLIKKISLLTYEIQHLKALFAQLFDNASNNNNKNNNQRSLPVLNADLNSNVCSSNGTQATTTISFGDSNTNSFFKKNATGNIVSSVNNSELPTTSKKAFLSVDTAAVNTTADIDQNNVANVDVLNGDVALDVQGTSNWTNVTNRRKKPKKNKFIVGDSNNAELEVAVRTKWVHLSSFKPTVSAEDITNYVSKHLDVDKSLISCYKLVKKDASLETLRYVNFKLGVPSAFYNTLLEPKLWTCDVKVRPFQFFHKKLVINQQI